MFRARVCSHKTFVATKIILVVDPANDTKVGPTFVTTNICLL